MEGFNWQCPFCGRHTTITNGVSDGGHSFQLRTKYGDNLAIWSRAIACPNESCKELSVVAELRPHKWANGHSSYGDAIERWELRPQASIKIFPDYVPAPVLEDYGEACLIRDLSPKASATLSRRCLQGMIRDFWDIKKRTLKDEVDALKERVDGDTWDAIDGVRQIGNIGAHMEKEINLVVNVEPDEASLLIGLIEILIEEWYIVRHNRQERMASVKAAAEKKKQLKDATAPEKTLAT
jgi:hypothetical protein